MTTFPEPLPTPPNPEQRLANELRTELRRLQAEVKALKRRALGSEACSGMLKGKPPTYVPMCEVLQAEVEALRRWKSTHAPRIKALEGLLASAQIEAAQGVEAKATLASERQANSILTDEVEALKAKLAEQPVTVPVEKLESLRFIQRVLEGDAPQADMDAAAQMVRDLRAAMAARPGGQT